MSATLKVSPDSWKEASTRSMKLSQAIIARSDRGILTSRRTDPLPLLRDACVKESNDRIHAYVRATRAVVVQLRKRLLATNEEIKALNRGKESLERALEHARKDLSLNHQSVEIRSMRPLREKTTDAADQLLMKERSHLLAVKRSLEAQLRKVQLQLQVLNTTRARLAAIIQERSRVTDLLCHSMSSTVAVCHFSPHRGAAVGQRAKGAFWPSSMPRQLQGSQRSGRIMRTKSYSAPVPLQCEGLAEEGEEEEEEGKRPGPYDVLSPESQESMEQAWDAISQSQQVRRELYSAIEQSHFSQQEAHYMVNEGLTRKLAETVTLTQHLQVNAGETHLGLHRGQRFINAQEKAQGYLLGPVSSSDLTTRERLDRPLVRIFQRHPGTDLPEASHLAQANAIYNESLQATRRNLMLLRLAEKGLQSDIRDKKTAAEIDSSVVRLRRQKANHRWVLDGTTSSQPPTLTKGVSPPSSTSACRGSGSPASSSGCRSTGTSGSARQT